MLEYTYTQDMSAEYLKNPCHHCHASRLSLISKTQGIIEVTNDISKTQVTMVFVGFTFQSGLLLAKLTTRHNSKQKVIKNIQTKPKN